MQQGKYRESILAIALEMSSRTGINILSYVKSIFILVFIFVLIDGLTFMFVYKKLTFRNTMKKYNNLYFFMFFNLKKVILYYSIGVDWKLFID